MMLPLHGAATRGSIPCLDRDSVPFFRTRRDHSNRTRDDDRLALARMRRCGTEEGGR